MAVRRKPQAVHDGATDEVLVATLRAADKPLDTATLARRLHLHPNGVRRQLQRLSERHVVEREQAHQAVGRPRDMWRLAPRAIAETDRPETGWALARALAQAIPSTPGRLREIENAGATLGRDLAGRLDSVREEDVRGTLERALEALGFEPRRRDRREDTRYTLTTCPYADAVRANPAVVCTLHRGIIRGVLAEIDPGSELVNFEPKDPDRAGCIVDVRTAGRAE